MQKTNFANKQYTIGTDCKMNNCFEKKIISRELLYDISQISQRKYKDNYFTKFLILLSNYVTYKGEEKYIAPRQKADMYIYSKRLMQEFNTRSFQDALNYLDYFKSLDLLDYFVSFEQAYHDAKVYVRFLKFRTFLYADENDNEIKRSKERYNINNHKGFFWIAANEMVDFFFNKISYAHGIQDIFLFLYLFTTYQDDQTKNSVIKNHHVVNFGYSYGSIGNEKQLSVLTYMPKLYITIKELADFFNLNQRSLLQMLQRLQFLGFIRKKFIRNKGTVIVMTCLDKRFEKTEEETNKLFLSIKRLVLTLKERRLRTENKLVLEDLLYNKEKIYRTEYFPDFINVC